MKEGATTVPVKLVSAVLVVGSVIGIGAIVGSVIQRLLEASQVSGTDWSFRWELWRWPSPWIIYSLFLGVFGFAVWIGIELWVGKPRGFKWAKILMLAQLPSVTIPGITYRFQTLGFTIPLFSSEGVHTDFKIGTSLTLYFSTDIQGFALGVNVVAIIALICLWRATRPKTVRPRPGSDYGLV